VLFSFEIVVSYFKVSLVDFLSGFYTSCKKSTSHLDKEMRDAKNWGICQKTTMALVREENLLETDTAE
jgi:hypothetical protein